ncbi:MAG: hexitol phosphatase HxpB [Bacteroidetes bacterium]|nr:hexitol phosphatase HxpB [Bacteroidota bacterium]
MLTTVIFDMDGLLIDSEPLWQEAGTETMARYNVSLSTDQYHSSTGLRTAEWVQHWFHHFKISKDHAAEAETAIVRKAIEKISARGVAMPGVQHILSFFKERGFRIGLASSSPMELIDVVVEKLQIGNYITVRTSAEHLPYGKPHPQVYLDCAATLGVAPWECVCFEDSFNGMIAAKAARMKCVVVPERGQQQQARWGAADLKLGSLINFNGLLLESLM